MSKPGRAPKPTKLKKLAGNPGQRRLNYEEPEFKEGIPDPPAVLYGVALEEWHRMVKLLDNAGVMTAGDSIALAAYCQHYDNWCNAINTMKGRALIEPSDFGGAPIVNGCMRAINDASDRMLRYLKEFGLTPSSRSSIVVNKDKPDNPLSGIFGSVSNG